MSAMEKDTSIHPEQMTGNRQRLWVRCVFPLAVGSIALAIFLMTLAPTVTAEDSGQLTAAAWLFGIPHPPGYPLWTFLCGIFVHIFPLGSVAYRANLFSAVMSASAAVMAYAAIRQLGIWRPIAGSAALIWIFGRWSWSQSVITEVYGLNSLLVAGLLLCALRWYKTRATKPLIMASLLAGLGMSNHHTIALVALALVVWIVVQCPSLIKQWRVVLCSLAMFAVGLLPYIYLPIRAKAGPKINWGNPSNVERFVKHVTRQQYESFGPRQVAEPRSLKRFGGQLGYVAQSVADDMTLVLAGVSIIGIAYVVRRDRRILWLVLLWLASTGGLFALLANYDLDRISRWAMRVFLIPAGLGLAIPLAYLLDGIGGRLQKISKRRMGTAVLILLAISGPLVQVYGHWGDCDYSNYWYAYDHGQNYMKCMQPNAVLFPSCDHNIFPMVYLLWVEGWRSDILLADISGYVRPELYTDRPADSADSPMVWLLKHARRPAYFAKKESLPFGNARFVPAGMLYHLMPRGLMLRNEKLLDDCDYRNLRSPTVIDYGANYILADHQYFHGLDRLKKGNRQAAMEHFQSAAKYAAGIKEPFNNIGSVLAEHGMIDECFEYFKQAVSFDGYYLTPRWNMVEIYTKQGRWREARPILMQIIQLYPNQYRAYSKLG
ncbi:MAG: protein O-mannosyl-transferase family, partial [Planctomycetota bacterium]